MLILIETDNYQPPIIIPYRGKPQEYRTQKSGFRISCKPYNYSVSAQELSKITNFLKGII